MNLKNKWQDLAGKRFLSSLKKGLDSEGFKRFQSIFGPFFLRFILVLALIISLLPIIAWWGGLIALAYLAYEFFKNNFHRLIRLEGKSLREVVKRFSYIKLRRLAYYAILFGIVIHGACRVHSCILVNRLYHEALHEKNVIISNGQN